jgi:N-methylhydantoinase A
MVGAIRAVSIQRGIDIRGFTLLAGGGAGGLHAVALARELQIAHVLIPREAGTLCAFGMTVTDVRYDESAARHTLSNAADFTTVDGVLSRLETSARARLREEGFAPEAISLERSVDARYPGQVHELTVPVPGTEKLAAADIAVIEQAFHAAHASRFTYSRPELPVEFLHWRVTAVGASSAVPVARPTPSASDGAPCGSRPAYDADAGQIVTMPVFQADDLSPGATLAGPAIIQASTTTVLLGAGDMLSVDADFGLSIAVALRERRRVAA